MNSPGAKIFEATEKDDLETVKMLIESGGVLPSITRPVGDEYSNDVETLAQVAARRGNFGILKYLLEKDSSLLEQNSADCLHFSDSLSVLEEAVAGGDLDMVKYLVEVHNDDIFRRRFISPGSYRTAADFAVEKGHLDIVRYFIEERHADPNTNRPPGSFSTLSDPLLFTAVREKQHNITKYLIEDRQVKLTLVNLEGENILFPAVSNGDLDFIKNMLDVKEAEIDINWRDEKGRTVVYLTVLDDRIDILRYLVEQKKADVNIPSGHNERTPLLEAIFSSNVEVFKYLVDHGADLEKRDTDGRTPLHLAANNDEFCKHLLEHGANAKSKDNKGETPLHIAMAARNLKASKYLIDFSGNVNEKNEDGDTLLHIVATRGERKLVVYLVKEKHAAINAARERDHWTPLHCAALWGHRKICEYLIEQGADPRAKDKMGRTPAQVACDRPLIDYIQKAAGHPFWIPAQPYLPNNRTWLTGGQQLEETISANGINAFHIHSALAFTDYMIRYFFPSSVNTRRIEVHNDLASNTGNLPDRFVHIAEDAVHAFLDSAEEEEQQEVVDVA